MRDSGEAALLRLADQIGSVVAGGVRDDERERMLAEVRALPDAVALRTLDQVRASRTAVTQ